MSQFEINHIYLEMVRLEHIDTLGLSDAQIQVIEDARRRNQNYLPVKVDRVPRSLLVKIFRHQYS